MTEELLNKNNEETLNKAINEYSVLDEKFEVFNILTLILKYKYIILFFVIASSIVAAVIAFKMPNWYSSTASLVPPKNSETGIEGMMSSLSSTLKDIGLSKLGGKSSEGYTFMVILDSRTVKDSLIKKFNLAKEYDIPDTLPSLVLKELESNLDIRLDPEGNYTISISSKDKYRAVEMVNYYIKQTNSLAEIIYRRETDQNLNVLLERLRLTDSVLSSVSDQLQKFTSKSRLFSPLDQAKSISTALAELKAETIKQEIVVELYKNRYGDSDPYTIEQRRILQDIRNKFEQAQTQPGFAGNFPLTDASRVATDYMKLYSTYETFTKVRSFLKPMIEQLQMDEKKNIRTLYIVDPPIPADKKVRPLRSLIVAGTAVGTFFLCLFFIIIIYICINFKNKYKNFLNNKRLQ